MSANKDAEAFLAVWGKLAGLFVCSKPGGKEQERVLREWIAAGRPEIEPFIRARTGVDATTVAELAATIAAGIESGLQASPAVESVSGGPSWGSEEDVARRAVAVARAILAEVHES